MRLLDKLIRYWRVKVALRKVPSFSKSVFDIGCDDGYLLRKVSASITKKDGIDPRLDKDMALDGSTLARGYFPKDLTATQLNNSYDAVFALAVFEHFSEEDLKLSAEAISKLLSKNGRLIVTIPDPIVDKILDVLMFLKLIDGQATEEHHGFDPKMLAAYFKNEMALISQEKFQLGLNNLFVFGRK